MTTIKRFSNRAQLVRHIADTTELSEEVVWEQIDEQLEGD